MKTYAALALLSLTLAACSQQAIISPDATTAKASSRGEGVVVYRTTDEAQEAQVLTELNRLGMGTQLSAQAVAGQVYLNVLPVSASTDSVRAYVKSTFASPATCSLTWGDSSAGTPFVSPTTLRIDTRDHAYAVFGSYTITATCKDGSTVLGTQSITVSAGKKATAVTLNFDSPAAPSGDFLTYYAYTEQGFTLTNSFPAYNFVRMFNPNYGLGYYWGTSQGAYTYASGDSYLMEASDGALFTLKSLEAICILRNQVCDFNVTGYKQDGTKIFARTQEIANASSTLTLNSDWTNLTRVTFGNTGQGTPILLDNIVVSK